MGNSTQFSGATRTYPGHFRRLESGVDPGGEWRDARGVPSSGLGLLVKQPEEAVVGTGWLAEGRTRPGGHPCQQIRPLAMATHYCQSLRARLCFSIYCGTNFIRQQRQPVLKLLLFYNAAQTLEECAVELKKFGMRPTVARVSRGKMATDASRLHRNKLIN